MPLDLLSIADALDEQLGKSEGRIGIAVETGEDEAIIVGTSQGLIRFASALVRSAAGLGESEVKLAGSVAASWSVETHALWDPSSEIAITSECLVACESNVHAVLQYFKANSPRASEIDGEQ
ncbi:MAG: hypothetical protein AAGI88_13795 [Pseudomonadota bacterium]